MNELNFKTICGIYKITSPSNKVYIGQSVDIIKRLNQYRSNKNCRGQTKLYNSFVKYGIESHKFEVVEECKSNILNERERYWQDFYDCSSKNGLNCRLTTTKDKSGKLNDDVIEKIRIANTGYKHTPEALAKIKANGEKLKGTKRDPELVARITQTKRSKSGPRTGAIISQETRDKMSKSLKGIKRSEEFKENLRKIRTGWKLSPETCKKVSEALKGSKWSEETRNKFKEIGGSGIAKKVINTKTLEIFLSAKEANDTLNWPKGKLAKYLRGDRTNNTDFVYLKDYEKE